MTTAFVDASRAAVEVTQRSHSGHISLVEGAPVKRCGERQTTIEASAFSSEFVATRHCVEDIECLRLKLRMFGTPLGESRPETRILRGNEAVVKNSSRVESTLSKKHSADACHFTRWNAAAKACLAGWIPTAHNVADAMTKLLPEAKRSALFCHWVC